MNERTPPNKVPPAKPQQQINRRFEDTPDALLSALNLLLLTLLVVAIALRLFTP